MGEVSETESSRTQQEDTQSKKQEEDLRTAKWLLGLLFSGAAWLVGKASEWLFVPSEPQAWWVWTKRVYFGVVYTAAVVQLLVLLYQLYVVTQEERKTKPAELPPGQNPNDEWPKDFKGWVRHISLVLVCWLGFAVFIAFCLAYGYVMETIKPWFSSWFS